MDSPWQKDTTKLFSSQYYLNRIYATKYIFYGIRPFYIKQHESILSINRLRKVKLNVSTNFSKSPVLHTDVIV